MLVCDTFVHDSMYCNERKVDGVRNYVIINPQLALSDVITVTRYYDMSSLDPSYKKRVSWLVDNDGPSDVAVVEYKGVQLDAMVHGNASKTKRPYAQMPAVITAPPKSVYSDCLMNMSPTMAPCSCRAVKDKKHNELQKQRKKNQTVHRLMGC